MDVSKPDPLCVAPKVLCASCEGKGYTIVFWSEAEPGMPEPCDCWPYKCLRCRDKKWYYCYDEFHPYYGVPPELCPYHEPMQTWELEDMRDHYTYAHIHFVPVLHPSRISFPNDYECALCFDEQALGGKYDYMIFERGRLVCTDPGDYTEPPFYEPEPYELLVVRPKLKYWGKGL